MARPSCAIAAIVRAVNAPRYPGPDHTTQQHSQNGKSTHAVRRGVDTRRMNERMASRFLFQHTTSRAWVDIKCVKPIWQVLVDRGLSCSRINP